MTDNFEKPKDAEQRSEDIMVLTRFFQYLSEHFGLGFDDRLWGIDIAVLSRLLRGSSESNNPDIMRVFSEFYRVVLKEKLSRYFRAEVGKLTTVN